MATLSPRLLKGLISLPDISRWNIYNVSDISYLFSEFNSLVSFPDIFKWKIDMANKSDYVFSHSFNCLNIK